MKCPHCLTDFRPAPQAFGLGNDADFDWIADAQTCPACHKRIITLRGCIRGTTSIIKQFLAYPRAVSRAPVPLDVPSEFSSDYSEACAVLSDSPKASAALSRRCLQHILREKAGVRRADLSKEIDEVLASRQLPTYLAESVDAIRNIGNFAAHPQKSSNSGELVDVEPGEAEWQLDVLEGLFDFYFVQPALLKKKRAALDKKLAEAGKPPMK